MAQGRVEGRAVANYLEALRSAKPARNRQKNEDAIRGRLAAIDEEIAEASVIEELKLRQLRRSLEAELASAGNDDRFDELETAFCEIAKSYSERKGISYATWREIGVSAATLRRAGINRNS